MRFEDLQRGQHFNIDGAYYEAETIGERVVIAYVLTKAPRVSMDDPNIYWVRQPDPKDLAGDQFLTDAFSDLRFNKNNLTDFERQCDEDLKAIL